MITGQPGGMSRIRQIRNRRSYLTVLHYPGGARVGDAPRVWKVRGEVDAGQATPFVIVPRYPQIAVGTLRSIIRQAGVTVERSQRLPD